jgi:hypothetical protein
MSAFLTDFTQRFCTHFRIPLWAIYPAYSVFLGLMNSTSVSPVSVKYRKCNLQCNCGTHNAAPWNGPKNQRRSERDWVSFWLPNNACSKFVGIESHPEESWSSDVLNLFRKPNVHHEIHIPIYLWHEISSFCVIITLYPTSQDNISIAMCAVFNQFPW